ncbi:MULTISPECIES: hypothetical protein [unclassified Microcoleus]|uniref:hypothetical protein n=1 Tax=unclassified Microcoleus TaxID=2642155 RepID=UPI002FD23E90
MSQRNVQLIESLIQVILSLSADEQLATLGKIFKNILYSSTQQLVQRAQKGSSFDLLNRQPQIYTLEDSESIV